MIDNHLFDDELSKERWNHLVNISVTRGFVNMWKSPDTRKTLEYTTYGICISS